jgi:hypothetical protein
VSMRARMHSRSTSRCAGARHGRMWWH